LVRLALPVDGARTGRGQRDAAFIAAEWPGESRVPLPPDASVLAGALSAAEQGSVHVWEQDIGVFCMALP
jgi:hypothetical protein